MRHGWSVSLGEVVSMEKLVAVAAESSVTDRVRPLSLVVSMAVRAAP